MEALIKGRQEGKTTALMEWVMGGHKIHRYPGWSRIAIVIDMSMYEFVKGQWWGRMEDFSHRVFLWDEFSGNQNFWGSGTEVRIDNLDLLLMRIIPGVKVTGFTMTGELWKMTE